MSEQNTEPIRTNFETNKIKDYIKLLTNMISELKEQNMTTPFEFEMEIMVKHPEFYQQYPFLVKKLCKGDDITMIYTMLENLDAVQKGDKSLASVELKLGEQLASKYLYPNIKN
jgi:hypothetical protein